MVVNVKTRHWRTEKLDNVTLHDVVQTSVVESAGKMAGPTLSRNKKRSAPIKTMFSCEWTQVFSWSIPQSIIALCRNRRRLHDRFTVREQDIGVQILADVYGNQLE